MLFLTEVFCIIKGEYNLLAELLADKNNIPFVKYDHQAKSR